MYTYLYVLDKFVKFLTQKIIYLRLNSKFPAVERCMLSTNKLPKSTAPISEFVVTSRWLFRKGDMVTAAKAATSCAGS